jgi:hypothetical protein
MQVLAIGIDLFSPLLIRLSPLTICRNKTTKSVEALLHRATFMSRVVDIALHLRAVFGGQWQEHQSREILYESPVFARKK